MTECNVAGCAKRIKARGWCSMHYWRWQTHGDPDHVAKQASVEWLKQAIATRDRTTCWDDPPWRTVTTEGGYPVIRYEGHSMVATRVVMLLTHRPRPAGHEVLHSCDNKRCLNPEHIRWGTRSENVREAYERGLNPRLTVGICEVEDCEKDARVLGKCKRHYMQAFSREYYVRVQKEQRRKLASTDLG